MVSFYGRIRIMAITSQDIVALEQQLADFRKNLEAEYASFGESCALIEGQHSLGMCREEWQAYETCLQAVTELEKVCAKQQRRLDLISDKKGHIRQTEKDLRLSVRQKRVLSGRIGAAAYEAYQSGSCPPDLDAASSPFFRKHLEETRAWETLLKKGGIARSLAKTKLSCSKHKTYALFMRCGQAFLADGSFRLLPDAGLRSEAESFLSRQQELSETLDVAKSNVSSLQDEVDKGKQNLEEAKGRLSVMKGNLSALATAYGKAVYDRISPDVIAQKVGRIAYGQGLAIVRRQNDITVAQESIRQLRNQMQIDELNVQLELDNRKIDHLREQEQVIEKQISEVRLSMAERQRKIRALSGEDHG